MKNIIIILGFMVANQSVWSQNWATNLSLSLRKNVKISSKSSIDLRQQFQFTPSIQEKNTSGGDFFTDDGFWPIPDDDDSDNDQLNDTPKDIFINWRSASSVQYNYRFFPWLRNNEGYTILFDGEDFRHTFRTELDYRPMRHGATKYKIDIALRALVQYLGQTQADVLQWDALFVPRMDIEWAFKKNHVLGLSNDLNGAWNQNAFQFDRRRTQLKFVLIYEKIHRFTFGYQYQKKINTAQSNQGASFGYEIRF